MMPFEDFLRHVGAMLGHAQNNIMIQRRVVDAYTYVEKYKIGTLGDNIWHAILDDAIRMREEAK